jgi:hypothetical protein
MKFEIMDPYYGFSKEILERIDTKAKKFCADPNYNSIPGGNPKSYHRSCILDYKGGALAELRNIEEAIPEPATDYYAYADFNSGVLSTQDMLLDAIKEVEAELEDEINN